MANDSDFVQHCRELLVPLGAVRVRRMFGGHGFYVDELFIALIAFGRLYLKADASTRARFEAARIDACACQTQRDWDDYHAQMARFHDLRDAFLQRYLPLVTTLRPVPAGPLHAWERPPD